MPQDVRRDFPADLRPVGDLLDDLLRPPGADRKPVVEREPRLQERPHPQRHGYDA